MNETKKPSRECWNCGAKMSDQYPMCIECGAAASSAALHPHAPARKESDAALNPRIWLEAEKLPDGTTTIGLVDQSEPRGYGENFDIALVNFKAEYRRQVFEEPNIAGIVTTKAPHKPDASMTALETEMSAALAMVGLKNGQIHAALAETRKSLTVLEMASDEIRRMLAEKVVLPGVGVVHRAELSEKTLARIEAGRQKYFGEDMARLEKLRGRYEALKETCEVFGYVIEFAPDSEWPQGAIGDTEEGRLQVKCEALRQMLGDIAKKFQAACPVEEDVAADEIEAAKEPPH